MKKVDLHTHSRFSDGTSTPAEVVARAKSAGVELLILTDHDSVSGFPEAMEAGKASGVDVRCGIEINTVGPDNVHVLGYGLRWRDPPLVERLAQFRRRRVSRVERIVEKLRALGLDIELSDVTAQSHETLGRPHVADALRRKGLARSRQDAFNRFLTRGTPGYVESMGPSPEEAISLISGAGGFCILAHPQTVGDPAVVERWARAGLEGLEVYYSSHSPSDIVRYSDVAGRLGLLATGGTDFHGPGTGRDKPLGVGLPDEAFARFMERLARCS